MSYRVIVTYKPATPGAAPGMASISCPDKKKRDEVYASYAKRSDVQSVRVAHEDR